MTPVEVLQAARALIADPDHWCQHDEALTAEGYDADPNSPVAVRWCARGALSAANDSFGDAYEVLSDAIGNVVAFNDSHSHGEVLAAFDRAIETAK